MKASELIKELEKAIEEHGDLEVIHNNEIDGRVDSVGVYECDNGNTDAIYLFVP